MPEPFPFPIRTECPPGACVCDRDKLLSDPGGDLRVLRLTKQEEKKLIARIEDVSSLADLRHIQQRIHEQLGMELLITPSVNEMRTTRGIAIRLVERPGLCSKIRQSIPAAVRRCFEKNPRIVYAILDEQGLLGAGKPREAPPGDTA